MCIRDSSKDNADKKRVYTEVQQLAERFKEDNGSIICRDLLGMRAKAKDTPTPVSYTHLDVYKRQLLP